MATRIAARQVNRRFLSGGKILSEEEKAAENVYIKKTEQEKLEKLARKLLVNLCSRIRLIQCSLPNGGPKPEEQATTSWGARTDAKPISAAGASTEKVSTDKYKNYAVVAGIVTGFGALGWYLKSSGKKTEVQD